MIMEVFMGRPAGWMQKLTGRWTMRSPGAPSLRSEIERLFWEQIATGITSEKAAEAVGVSSAVGTRWFRYRGGMPLFMSRDLCKTSYFLREVCNFIFFIINWTIFLQITSNSSEK